MPPKLHESPSSSRGRDISSKPLTASSSSAKSNVDSHKHLKLPRSLSASTNAEQSADSEARPKLAVKSSSARPDSRLKSSDTKHATETVNAPIPEPPRAESSIAEGSSSPTANTNDPLQVAAQAYPWLYMASTLEACFSSSEESALKLISEKEKQVEAAEGESQEQRTRVDAERAIEFYEELESDKFSKIAPAIMQSFHSHGDECARVETQALELALQGPADPNEDDPLQVYYDMLDNLDKLYKEARDLESKIVDFTSAFKGGATQTGPAEDTDIPSARSRILDVVTACLPVISARKSNLSMAQELIDSAQENCSITLRMESLGIE